MDAMKVDKSTHAVLEEIERHIKQTHTHAYDRGFEAGYRLALCHFGGCLEDMRLTAEYRGKDIVYRMAHFTMCTRHEEMVKLINHTPIAEVIGGKEGEWKKNIEGASDGLASLFG